jgi:GNAT superfamily N-acetyltransferase
MADKNRASVRLASREDVPFILAMIRELADYEHAANHVSATPALLEKWLFDEPVAECLVGSVGEVDCGIALFFTNFSTWEGIPGFFLEDLVVQKAARGKGLGKALLTALAQLALERGYTRIEWSCLDWNEPSLAFYQSLGALARTEWISHRLTRDKIELLAGQ